MADQLPEGEAFTGKGAGGRGDKDHPVRLVQGLDPAGVKKPLVQKIDQIQLIFVHPFQQNIRAVRADRDGDVRIKAVIAFDQLRQQGGADRFDCSDAEAARHGLAFLQGGFGLGEIGHQAAGMAAEDDALVSQGNLFPDAVKKPDAQLFLQLADLDGDGSLAVAQDRGCLGEAALAGDLQKGCDFAKFHADLP